MSDALADLVAGMQDGASWDLMGRSDAVRERLDAVFAERIHANDRGRYQLRVNLQTKTDVASYAGFIVEEGNPPSGPYQGTSFVWFPGEGGSVAALGIGTDGFGADTAILGRPGHGRRLRALSRLHGGRLWVKPDLLDIATELPGSVSANWPAIDAAMKAYSRVLYAATPVRAGDHDAAQVVADLLDLFFYEHRSRHKGPAQTAWQERLAAVHAHVFPATDAATVASLLQERRFVILEGPPGTGKTRLALEVGRAIGSYEMVQFHPARTYEDFVVGLYPRATGGQLAFEVRPGDLLRANASASGNPHVLVIDEINRADLGRVLGEAVSLFEPGEPDRRVRLPHTAEGFSAELQLSPHLYVLGTRNTADRSIARIDLAIRRRFAFVDVWPELSVVEAQGDELAAELFGEVLATFTEFADDDALRLVPGHAYFLDPRPDLPSDTRGDRIRRRVGRELLPLLRDYVSERLAGPATLEVAGLADRIEARLQEH
ncbi:MAG TPA: AAA family ATPase [Solirubrobacteraceae bacterium]|jgi:5-methylcytosine-specific restriction protein B|nr:AAA family ATPase [Solirubrobacteraceae bacterium]